MFNDYFDKVRPVMVLATAVNNIPSSRIVSYVFSPKKENIIYVITQPKTSKVKEIMQNNKVSIVTISGDNGETISSNNAIARISDISPKELYPLFETNPQFVKRHPDVSTEIVIEIELFSAIVDSDDSERQYYEF
uniref:pyridoxamine 5'-phosphate oxidase family protein n=1 Tax=Candidatus Enterococcus willemsii TaxID=1857215 RepID=UPI00403FB309